MRRALLIALMLSSTLSTACARELLERDPFVEPDLSGSVRIPLSATAEDGTLYLLRDATVEISGSAMFTLRAPVDAREPSNEIQLAASERTLSTPLPAGVYTLFLRPGFNVLEIAPDGTRRQVEVTLAGANPQRFALREVEDATLRLRFAHGDRELVFGAATPMRLSSLARPRARVDTRR